MLRNLDNMYWKLISSFLECVLFIYFHATMLIITQMNFIQNTNAKKISSN